MATYNWQHRASGGNFKPGFNCVYNRFSATEQNLAANDIVRFAKIPDNAILYECWYRMPTASTSTGTMDVGTTYDGSGQEVVAALDLDGSNTEWAQGTIQTDGGAEEITDADSYLTLECLGAAMTDGVVEVAVIFLMFPPQTTPVADATITA